MFQFRNSNTRLHRVEFYNSNRPECVCPFAELIGSCDILPTLELYYKDRSHPFIWYHIEIRRIFGFDTVRILSDDFCDIMNISVGPLRFVATQR